ncbi:MAG: hypothetical protein M0R80_01800 [Proteobacteria bacterium]|jgi:hypothetical protein|nr:hypothetical protein [Pseudomonadota bacterium]
MKTFQQFMEMARVAAIKPAIKSQMNREINAIAKGFHDKIPLSPIFAVLEKLGYQAVQEDGTPWSGMLVGGGECGSEQSRSQVANIDIVRKEDNTPMNNALYLSWCKMPSGRYEVVAYIS